MDAVIKETLRVRPVVTEVFRAPAAPVELGGYRFEPGTQLAASTFCSCSTTRSCIHLTRTPSGPSASSKAPLSPIPGFRSAAACAAVSALLLRSSR